jgi:hypothetical protein
MSVVPSGAADLRASAAMRPVAPGRFSTTTGCPMDSLMSSAIRRAVISDVPPAATGTRIRTGRVNAFCARASGDATAAIAAASAKPSDEAQRAGDRLPNIGAKDNPSRRRSFDRMQESRPDKEGRDR